MGCLEVGERSLCVSQTISGCLRSRGRCSSPWGVTAVGWGECFPHHGDCLWMLLVGLTEVPESPSPKHTHTSQPGYGVCHVPLPQFPPLRRTGIHQQTLLFCSQSFPEPARLCWRIKGYPSPCSCSQGSATASRVLWKGPGVLLFPCPVQFLLSLPLHPPQQKRCCTPIPL